MRTLINALGDALEAAPSRERRQLAEAIESYATRHPAAFRDLMNGHPAKALREVLQEIVLAVDARPIGA